MRKLASGGAVAMGLAMLSACGDQGTDVRRFRIPAELPLASVSPADPTSETIEITSVDTAYGTGIGTAHSQAASPYTRIFRVTGTLSVSIPSDTFKHLILFRRP
ncbi:MAG TPA: hypothetical protein VF761_06250 [Gemmatimonadaceae bacterium]